MLNKITMPSAGQTIDSLTIARWCKTVGDTVARGDILLEVETDKATLPVESFAKGKLLQILVPEGGKASVGDVIAYVGEEGDLAKSAEVPARPAAVAPVDDDDYVPVMPGAAPARAPSPAATAPASPPSQAAWVENFVATPAAKKAARDAGIAIERIFAASGVSPVRKAAVLNFADDVSSAGDADSTLVPLTGMRRVIAARMSESAATIPSYTVEVEADMTALIAFRERLKARGDRVAFHDLFAKCAAAAALRHPYVNASWSEQGIRVHKRVHVGIAVAVDNGLVVPVVRDVDARPVTVIATESAALIEKARSGTLTPDAMKGGTITVSNLGSYPVSRFTAIINPPESCILAIGAALERPALRDGELVFRPVVAINASFDHRVVDGAYGAAFLATLKGFIEDPAMMIG